jgi:hypothetical protein
MSGQNFSRRIKSMGPPSMNQFRDTIKRNTIPIVDTSATDDVYANYNDMGPKYGRGGPAIAIAPDPETISVSSGKTSKKSSTSSSSRGKTSKRSSSSSSRGSSTSGISSSSMGSSSSVIIPVQLMPRPPMDQIRTAPPTTAPPMTRTAPMTDKRRVMSEAFIMKSYYYPSDDSPNSINGTFVIDFNSILLEQLQNTKQKGGANVCSEETLALVGPNIQSSPTLAQVTKRYQLNRTPIGTMSAMYECMAISAAMEIVSYDQASLQAAQAALAAAQAALAAAQAILTAAVLPVPNHGKPNPVRRGIARFLYQTNHGAFSPEAARIIATQLGGVIVNTIPILTGVPVVGGPAAAGAAGGPAALPAAYNGVIAAAIQFDIAQANVVMGQAVVAAAAADPLAVAAGVTFDDAKAKFGRTLVHGNAGYGRGGINPADTTQATNAIIAINAVAPPAVGPSNFELIWINFKTAIANWIGANATNKLINFIWDDKEKQFIIQIFDIPIAPAFTPIGPAVANCFMITRQLRQSDLSHITMHRPRVQATKMREFKGASSLAGTLDADGNVVGGVAGPIHVKRPKLTIGTTWVLCADFNCAAGPVAIANPTYVMRHLNLAVVRRDVSIPVAQPFFNGLMQCFAQEFITNASLTAHPQYILNNPGLDPVLKTELNIKLINACVSAPGIAALWPGYLTRAQMPLNTLCMVTSIGDATNAPSTYSAWVTCNDPVYGIYVQPANQAAAVAAAAAASTNPNAVANVAAAQAAAIIDPIQNIIVVAEPGAVNSNALVKIPTGGELADVTLFPHPNFVARQCCMSRDFVGTSYNDRVVWFHAVIATLNPFSVDIFPNAPTGLVVPPPRSRARAAALALAAAGVRRGVLVSIYAIKPCDAAEALIVQQLIAIAHI